jgi:hypothetical protein
MGGPTVRTTTNSFPLGVSSRGQVQPGRPVRQRRRRITARRPAPSPLPSRSSSCAWPPLTPASARCVIACRRASRSSGAGNRFGRRYGTGESERAPGRPIRQNAPPSPAARRERGVCCKRCKAACQRCKAAGKAAATHPTKKRAATLSGRRVAARVLWWSRKLTYSIPPWTIQKGAGRHHSGRPLITHTVIACSLVSIATACYEPYRGVPFRWSSQP